jgi:hypothetical protein
MPDTNLLLNLTPREIEVIRMALRLQEENHKRNGFNVLILEVADLRSKIADSLLDSRVNVG